MSTRGGSTINTVDPGGGGCLTIAVKRRSPHVLILGLTVNVQCREGQQSMYFVFSYVRNRTKMGRQNRCTKKLTKNREITLRNSNVPVTFYQKIGQKCYMVLYIRYGKMYLHKQRIFSRNSILLKKTSFQSVKDKKSKCKV